MKVGEPEGDDTGPEENDTEVVPSRSRSEGGTASVPSAKLPNRRRPAHFPAQERHGRAIINFVTVCTKDRRPVLANAAAHAVLVEAWREATWFAVGRYVIMPDHVHLFCGPATNPPEALARWVNFWKSLVARRWPDGAGDKLWQRDFWDVQLRRGESYAEKWDYVRNNPVRASLAKRVEDWPFQGELEVLWWREP